MHVYRACNDRAERSAAGYSTEQTCIQRGEVVGGVLRSQGAEGYYRIERVFNSGEPYTNMMSCSAEEAKKHRKFAAAEISVETANTSFRFMRR